MKMLNSLLASLRWLSKILSRVITTIILTLVYIFGLGPLALLGKLVGKDFIGEKKRDANSYWHRYHAKEPTLENFLKPY